MSEMAYRFRGKSLALAVLSAAAIGGIAFVAICAPNALQVLGRRYQRDEWWSRREAERRRIREALERLRKRRLVVFEQRGHETYIRVTEEGRQHLRQLDFDAMTFERPKRWDGVWRIIIFDIPEKKASQRKSLRDKFHELGFYQLQKSAWIFPYECHDEVDFIARFLDVERHLTHVETRSLERQEGEARRAFGLL